MITGPSLLYRINSAAHSSLERIAGIKIFFQLTGYILKKTGLTGVFILNPVSHEKDQLFICDAAAGLLRQAEQP
jgi:hypothetical protein